MVNRKIADFIKTKREELGYTQEQLAAEVGVSRFEVEKWESEGDVELAHLLPLASVFGVEIEELLNGKAETCEAEIQKTEPTVEQPAEPKQEKNFYEQLHENLSDPEIYNRKVEPSGANGFWAGERIFGTIGCILALCIMFIPSCSRATRRNCTPLGFSNEKRNECVVEQSFLEETVYQQQQSGVGNEK